MKTILCLTLVVGVAVSIWAQAPRPSATAAEPAITINGRVVADATGDPVSNVRVALNPEPRTAPVAMTDIDGRFSSVRLPDATRWSARPATRGAAPALQRDLGYV